MSPRASPNTAPFKKNSRGLCAAVLCGLLTRPGRAMAAGQTRQYCEGHYGVWWYFGDRRLLWVGPYA